MYVASDPRSQLATAPKPAKAPVTAYAGAEYAKFYETEPQESSARGRTWYVRGQNFLVAYTEAEAGWSFERKGQPDEYVVLLPDAEAHLSATAADGSQEVKGQSLVIMPPGDSRIEMKAKGRVVQLFTTRSADLAGKCSNAASYASPHPNIPPFEPWPEPPAGYRIRAYGMNLPKQEGRFGRIFRCTTFMVNWFEQRIGPRDPKAMSPHHHDDFEQCSLCLEGEYVHHMRWPWTTDMTIWRDDDHELCGAPSVAIIPPPSIHTSFPQGPGANELVDIFSPPRIDFSMKPGWVVNADEYPMPDGK